MATAKEIGAGIKNARLTVGITQAELAHRLGVTPQAVSQYERGIKKPKIETIEKIADDGTGVCKAGVLYRSGRCRNFQECKEAGSDSVRAST